MTRGAVRVREVVRPAPATVTAYSAGDVADWHRRRAAPSHKSHAVLVRKVHPAVLETALRLAGGDPSRIQIVNEREVLVH